MEIHVRPIFHTHEEISMGQVIFYEPPHTCNSISVIANHNGFTTLSAVARKYDIGQLKLENLSELANHTQQIQLLNNQKRNCSSFPR